MHIYLDDRHDVSYDVTCEVPKADCENAPGTLCDAVAWEVSFDGAFDGDIPSRRRRRLAGPGKLSGGGGGGCRSCGANAYDRSG